MKIVTWNCGGGFRNKIGHADSLNADLLIIQECEDPALSSIEYRKWAGDYIWTGSNKNKGIGIFPKNGHSVETLKWSGNYSLNGLHSQSEAKSWWTEDLQLFLPFTLNNDINILACWTKGSNDLVFGYIGQLWKYIQIHRNDLKYPRTIIAGDLNSNAIWDKPDRWWNHSDAISELEELGFESLYHYLNDCAQGLEEHPTFYLHRNSAKPYHIDYFLMTRDLLTSSQLEIGDIVSWLSVSDHMPLIATLEVCTS